MSNQNTTTISSTVETWFKNTWSQSFPGCAGAEPSPFRLLDLTYAAQHLERGGSTGEQLDFPSGNTGTVYDLFSGYKSGPDFLNDLLTELDHDEAEHNTDENGDEIVWTV